MPMPSQYAIEQGAHYFYSNSHVQVLPAKEVDREAMRNRRCRHCHYHHLLLASSPTKLPPILELPTSSAEANDHPQRTDM